MSERIDELVEQVTFGLKCGEGLGDELQTIRAIAGDEIAAEVEELLGGNV